jgi:hypothetical protein
MEQSNAQLVISMIEAIEADGKYQEESKLKMIEYYTVENLKRLNDLDQSTIEKHDFVKDMLTGASRLIRVERLNDIVVKLETHAYAPEMNCLHFKSGKTWKFNHFNTIDTIEQAVIYAALRMTEEDLEKFESDEIY